MCFVHLDKGERGSSSGAQQKGGRQHKLALKASAIPSFMGIDNESMLKLYAKADKHAFGRVAEQMGYIPLNQFKCDVNQMKKVIVNSGMTNSQIKRLNGLLYREGIYNPFPVGKELEGIFKLLKNENKDFIVTGSLALGSEGKLAPYFQIKDVHEYLLV